jgi:hypothetical protein
MRREQSQNAIRQPVIALLLVTAAAHVPVISEHLEEAPYMGYLFIGFTLATFALATALAVRPGRSWYLVAAGVCATGIVAYVATRLVAFPRLADDVGMWTEPLGMVCITTEAAAVALSLVALRRSTAAPHSPVRNLRTGLA